MYEREIGKFAEDLGIIEKQLLSESKQRNALLLMVTRADEILKDFAKRKYFASKSLKDAVSQCPTSRSDIIADGIVSPSNDFASLISAVSETERDYADKKEARDHLNAQLEILDKRISDIENRKNMKIIEMTRAITKSEEVQNEIISRSIHSAIESFPIS
jgi:hypothetical protein